MGLSHIYLDYNATAPLRPEARVAMMAALDMPHNASSLHSFGRAGRKIVEEARGAVAALCGAPSSAQVVLNSGATEGNNTVLHHFKGARILVFAREHPSVLEAASRVTNRLEMVPETEGGVVDLLALEESLKKEPAALVSVMAVQNETGVIQPVAAVSALAHRFGALYHCDGVQAVGRMPFDMQESGVDFLTLSAHKMGGPQGVGALVMGFCGETPTLLYGGGQERGARAGTQNVAGIAGFGAAAQAALRDLPVFQGLETVRDHLEREIEKISPDVVFYGRGAARAANTSAFSLPQASPETLLMALDLDGVAVSAGSACSSGRVKHSALLRISMGWDTTPADIEGFLKVWTKIYDRLKERH